MNLQNLLNSDNRLNTAIMKNNDKLLEMDEYSYVMEHSKSLDIFKNISFSDRFWFVYENMHLEKCKTCGKPYILFKRSQKRCSLCNHRQHTSNYIGANSRATADRNKDFINSLADQTLILSTEEFKSILTELANKNKNYSFIISKKYFNFYHDLMIKTKDIIPIDDNEFRLSERFFIISSGMKALPKCKFCGKPVKFINRIAGYRDNCRDCEGKKINEWRENDNKEKIMSNFNFDKYEIISIPKITNEEPLIIRCRKCGHISNWYLINGALKNLKNLDLCKNCEHLISHKEENLYEFIKSVSDNIVIHKKDSRKIIPPLELDIYVPERKLAFEFDGLYWHSSKDKDYHLHKTLECEKKGIQLIHIFENEWDFKQDIVKSRIRNLFGISKKTIYARKCEVKEVSSKESKDFQNENHIQGSCNSSINVGLYYDNELVSLMTFGKSRFNKKYEYEMLRFCNKIDHHIPGGAGKLLSYFEKTYKPKSLISYADRRWSKGNVYEKLEFRLDHASKPDYWYIDKNKNMHSRVKYQKHKLQDLLKTYDPNKTEVENMSMNGYSRIFDCGNLVYVKTY